jgi:LPS-assembly protein
MPTFLNGWTFRPELGARETLYADRLLPATGVPVGVTAGNPINRNVLNASVEVRPPSVSKIFEHKPFGYVYKNTIEPSVIYRYQSGIENFAEFIRFDQRDILADTNEVRYGVITRLYAKKTKSPADCFNHPKYLPLDQAADPVKAKAAFDAGEVCDDSSGPAKEVVSLELAQKYYMNTTFGGALVPGSRNVFDDTVDLTGIAFLNEPRRFSPIVSRLKAQYGTVDFQWALDYDTVLHQVNASTIFAGYGWHNWGVGGGQTYLNAPGEVIPGPNGTMVPDIFNQYRMMLLYGNLSRVGPNAAFTVGWDAKNKYIQYTAMQVTYNWDCCGVTFEYRRWALGLVRNENFYKFALTLANFGTFGNLRRQDRLY